jgi:hypothetical protein
VGYTVSLRTVAEALVARQNLANNPAPAASKMRNHKTVVDGITFASKWEAHRYVELKMMQMGGLVKELELQVVMPLVVNGLKVCEYIADFVYMEQVSHRELEEWRLVVEDAKGFRTDTYKLKKKLLFACRGIEIRETRKRI